VPAEAMVQQLSVKIMAQEQEMAAMRVYIDRLHQALSQATMTKETEDANEQLVSEGEEGSLPVGG
jgi:hypothetical protein